MYKAILQQQGYPFQADTDSEVIVQLIAAYHDQGYSVEAALVAAPRQLQGAFAFALLTTHTPETLRQLYSALVPAIRRISMRLPTCTRAARTRSWRQLCQPW